MAKKQLISEVLKAAIESSGLTRYRISQESEIAESVLSRFVAGKAGLSLANVDRLCKCLNLRLTEDPKPAETKTSKRK
jgi:ribosome-binding protein aMBF1 (putative translation factor)